jgi:hypothetical protein
MPANLEERLERATDSLPLPAETVTARARESALAALPRRASRRRFTRGRPLGLIAAGAVIAIALAVALAAPWDGRAPLVTERALAAIGSQPVIHAIVENTRPHATIVDLASGQETTQLLRTEYWFDDERALLRARITIDGTLQTELLLTREGGRSELGPIPGNPTEPRLPPALAGFASGYRDALESGDARVIGETRIEGQDAVLLQIELLSPPIDAGSVSHAEVAVDAESYEPLRFRYRSGNETSEWWRVVSIETLAREESQFAPPTRSEPRPRRQTGTDERTLTPAEAATALDRPAVWPGPDVAGIQLAEIELMKLTTEWTDDRETVSRALVLQYGPRRYKAGDEPWLTITQTTSRAENLRFLGFGGRDAQAGEVKLVGFGDLDGSPADMWSGSMMVDGVYVALESAQREVILAAARAMESIE